VRLYSLSLLKSWRSLYVFEKKNFSSLMILRCFYCPQKFPDSVYLGIRASKKVGGAVVRNLLRRRMRNLVQASFNDQSLHGECAYLISILPPASNVSFLVLKNDFTQSCRNLYKKTDLAIKSFDWSKAKEVISS
jgi:ribonuclease P protein component